MKLIRSETNRYMRSGIFILFVLIVIVGVLVAIVHWPGLSAKAISFDDRQYLIDNILVQNPSLDSAGRFLSEVLEPSTVGGYYQPLSMISLMIDRAAGGQIDNLRPFHRTSLFLHVVNTILIVLLLYQLFDQIWIAAIVGLLFGLHPMTVEPIPWVGERKTLLAAFFALWCLVVYVWYAKRGSWKLYMICLVMYLLALMSKPTSTPVPVLLLLLDYWPLRRLGKRAVLEKIPFFVMGGIFAIITFVSQTRTAATMTPVEYGIERVPLILCHNIVFYLSKIFWPINLSSHYPFPEPLGLSQPMVLIGVVGTILLLVVLVISCKQSRALVTGWLFFFLAILPTMQIIGFSNVIASDKFAYLPAVGLLLPLTVFLIRFWERTGKIAVRILFVLVIAALCSSEAVATRRYLIHWQDSESLWRYMVSKAPGAYVLHRGLGKALVSQGRIDDAIQEYRESLKLKPNNALLHNDLGVAFLKQGEINLAMEHFEKALQLRPNLRAGLNNMAWVMATSMEPGLRNPDKAVRLAELACELTKYKDAGKLDTLGAAYAAAGRFDEAIETTKKALEILHALGQERQAGQVSNRLDLYRNRMPYYND